MSSLGQEFLGAASYDGTGGNAHLNKTARRHAGAFSDCHIPNYYGMGKNTNVIMDFRVLPLSVRSEGNVLKYGRIAIYPNPRAHNDAYRMRQMQGAPNRCTR